MSAVRGFGRTGGDGDGVASPFFVGRQAEMSAVRRVLDRAQNSESGLLLIGGEAGVGKTRIVEEATAAAAAAGMRTLAGHCVQLGPEGLPFAPIVEALRVLSRSIPRVEFDEVLGPARELVSRLLPSLSDAPLAPSPDYASQGSQLLELVLGLIERLSASRPVLLVIEDLHWADQSTLELTAFLSQALRGAPVAIIATYRSDEMHRRHPLRPLLSQWERARSVERLEVDRFDRPELASQLAGILGEAADPTVVDLVFDRSEGNAFLAEEMLSAIQSGGDRANLPPSLRDLLLTRADGLSEPAQRILRTAAVAGRSVPERLLVAVSGLPEGAAFAALREAVENHLLVVDEAAHGYTFRHALARDAVYDDMLPGERSLLHMAYGEALSADPGLAGDDTTSVAASLAHHWYAALDLPRALTASVTAGRLATASYAPTEALTHYERALQIWQRVPDAEAVAGLDLVDLLSAASDAAYRSGTFDRAQSLLDQAIAELGPAGASERRATLLVARARVLRDLGQTEASIEVLRDALAQLPPEPMTVSHASVLSSLANALMRSSDMAQTRVMARRAVEAASAVNAVREKAEANITLGVTDIWFGEHESGLATLAEGLSLASESSLTMTALRAYVNLSDSFEAVGRSHDAVRTATAGIAIAEQFGLLRTMGNFLTGNLAESLTSLGQWERAQALIARSLLSQPQGIFGANLLEVQARLDALAGRYGDAQDILRRTSRLVTELQDDQYIQPLAFTTAEVQRAAGKLDEAIATATAALHNDESRSLPRYAWPLVWIGLRTHAERSLAERDRDERPAEPPQPLLDMLGLLQHDAQSGAAYRALCEAELARASTADPAAWQPAVKAWRELEWPYLLSYSLFREAEANCLSGNREQAAGTLAESLEIARRIGAVPVADAAVRLAQRARIELPSSSPAEAAPDAVARYKLTTRELEVLILLARGSSNPQIAKSLFISPKTASVHVSNILAKLGVASRVEAAGIAHRLDLLDQPPS